MLVAFKDLPEDARVWIYQANRKLSEEEVETIARSSNEFLKEWTAHGKDLKAGYEIRYNRFLVIGLDQSLASASGCSIDASVRFIQSLEKQLDVDLMDKMNVTFYNGPHIAHKTLKDFKQMAKARSISGKTIVFNNLVNTKAEYLENWEVPATESWHSRFLI